MTAVLLDSHVLYWSASDPSQLSTTAIRAIREADELTVAAITWYELAWLAKHNRISVTMPIRAWLEQLAAQVRTLVVTPAIADTAVSLPASFPGDPADRMIYATAIEHGLRLVTKDRRLRAHRHPEPVALW